MSKTNEAKKLTWFEKQTMLLKAEKQKGSSIKRTITSANEKINSQLAINKNYTNEQFAYISYKVGSILQEKISVLNIPGTMTGIWINDKPYLFKTAGVSNLQTGKKMDLKGKFRIASLTKTFTATVLLQLADEGKISLNDKLIGLC